jgi:hypothetical protein
MTAGRQPVAACCLLLGHHCRHRMMQCVSQRVPGVPMHANGPAVWTLSRLTTMVHAMSSARLLCLGHTIVYILTAGVGFMVVAMLVPDTRHAACAKCRHVVSCAAAGCCKHVACFFYTLPVGRSLQADAGGVLAACGANERFTPCWVQHA